MKELVKGRRARQFQFKEPSRPRLKLVPSSTTIFASTNPGHGHFPLSAVPKCLMTSQPCSPWYERTWPQVQRSAELLGQFITSGRDAVFNISIGGNSRTVCTTVETADENTCHQLLILGSAARARVPSLRRARSSSLPDRAISPRCPVPGPSAKRTEASRH